MPSGGGHIINAAEEKTAPSNPGTKHLGDAYVIQHLRDDNGCYGEVFTIVQNCASGEAVALAAIWA